jgi:dipeptidyl aminopeptidase/acylaminoacyl peptidase
MKITPIRKYKFALITFISLLGCATLAPAQTSSLKKLLSYPYPSNLTASSASGMLAWTFDYMGKRNIYISKNRGKSFKQITNYTKDDGQEISQLQFSPDGEWLVYMRGGEPGGIWSNSVPVDPASLPKQAKFQLFSLHIPDKKLKVLASGQSSDRPAISPDGKKVAFVKKNAVWIVPINGSKESHKLFFSRGNPSDLQWSPDGSKLAFVSNRGSHSFVGIFSNLNTPIHWIDPSFARDVDPVWSPGGDSLVFVRRLARGGAPDSITVQQPRPWEIRVADIHESSSKLVWKSPHTLNGSVPTTNGRYNLHWAANGQIVFLSTIDNWPHLYSISVSGGKPMLLTPGHFMVEYISLSPDKKHLVFSANTGPDSLDIDRRHIGIVSVDKQDMKILTPGDGIEAYPVFVGGQAIAFIGSTAYQPALPTVLSRKNHKKKTIGTSLLSSVYSSENEVKPKQVIFKSIDGTPIHGQLFLRAGGADKKPAVLDIHGGPMRQMLLGWNYSSYYAAHYAVNQWLADHGFVVLSVNYRMGIGYGNEFHHPPHVGREGASEYQDILAAGKWLANQSYIDAARIGVYGGSYGGYLTAFALGRNSDIFSAGVDISGVHSRLPGKKYTARIEHAPDAAKADTLLWQSSPIAYTDTWKSPVLIIHADDDRNVRFDQSVNLLNRLKKKGVHCETLVIPDDTHHWLRFHHLVRIYQATVGFLGKELVNK